MCISGVVSVTWVTTFCGGSSGVALGSVWVRTVYDTVECVGGAAGPWDAMLAADGVRGDPGREEGGEIAGVEGAEGSA